MCRSRAASRSPGPASFIARLGLGWRASVEQRRRHVPLAGSAGTIRRQRRPCQGGSATQTGRRWQLATSSAREHCTCPAYANVADLPYVACLEFRCSPETTIYKSHPATLVRCSVRLHCSKWHGLLRPLNVKIDQAIASIALVRAIGEGMRRGGKAYGRLRRVNRDRPDVMQGHASTVICQYKWSA